MKADGSTSSWYWFLGWPFKPFGMIFRWLRGAPRWMQLSLALSVVLIGSMGGYALLSKMNQRRQHEAVRQQWEQFDAAIRSNELSQMRESLRQLLQIEPTNQLAARRLAALEELDADPTDEAMVFLTMRLAMQQQKLDLAAREARKRLAQNDKDWLARCVVALNHLQQGDREAANRELDLLPDPTVPTAQVQPAGLLLAFRLFRAVERDLTPLLRFVESRVALVIRNPNLENLTVAEKLSLISCVLEGVTPRQSRLPASLVQSWAPLNNLLDGATEQALEADDLSALVQAGRFAPRMILFLQLLQRDEALTAEQADLARQDLEALTLRIWSKVQRLDPQNVEAYRGIAQSQIRQKNLTAAREIVSEGLATVGPDPELLTLFSRILQVEGRADSAYANLVEVARTEPSAEKAVVWWGLAAEAAIAASRRDLALEACQQMRQSQPDHPWANRTEALLWLDADQPRQALELLKPLGTAEILKQPLVARAYARALVAADQQPAAEQFLAEAEQASRADRRPGIVHAVLVGWLDAVLLAAQGERARALADKVDRLLEFWPEDLPLMRVRAAARQAAAKYSNPPWERSQVRAAILAHERIAASLPEEFSINLALAELHLLGEQNHTQALRDLGPPRPEDQLIQLASAELSLIGRVYRENKRLAESLRVLDLARRSRDAGANVYIQLALTLQQLGRTADARSALAIAQPMPRSPQEQLDYVAAAKLIVP